MYLSREPLALRLFYFSLTIPFFIYIPISFFVNDLFLLLLDLFLFVTFILTILNTNSSRKIFNGNIYIVIICTIYLLCILLRLIIDFFHYPIDYRYFISIRNLLIGIEVLVISSYWVTSEKIINKIISILLWCCFITSIYGIRQLIFGFMNFELERLSLMGSSLQEMDSMNRFRITSSFGDPLTFSFFMMIGVYMCILAKKRKIETILVTKIYSIVLLTIISALLLTLTRAPLFGLMIGFILYSILTFKLTKNLIFKSLVALTLAFILIISLDWIVTSKVLLNSNNQTLISIHTGIESFWTLFQIFKGSNIDPELYFLVNQSKDARTIAWDNGTAFLLNNPLGAGLTHSISFPFALTDVGFLKVGIELGIVGMTSIIFLFLYVGFNYFFITRSKKINFLFRYNNYIILSLWLSIFVVCGISSIIDTSVIALIIWTFAGIMLNDKKIKNNNIKLISNE